MEQKRFLIAVIISAAILFTWQYFFSPPIQPDVRQDANSATVTPSASPAQSEAQTVLPRDFTPQPDSASSRKIVVETPLYRATFESRGAAPSSWIIKKNKDNGREIYSVGGTAEQRQPLELIPQLSQQTANPASRELPLRFVTGDGALDSVLNERNYSLAEATNEGDQTIILDQNQQRRLTFALRDEASGIIALKTFDFDGDSYAVRMDARVERVNGTRPVVELSLGPNIGDQGVPRYTFYSVAPEAVISLGGDESERHTASAVSSGEGTSPGNLLINRPVHWAAIADTYFALAAIPTQPVERVRFTSRKYEHEKDGEKEERFVLDGFIPVPANGLQASLYVGPKDHDLLSAASAEIANAVGRQVDLDGLIDYGYLSSVFRYLALPIAASLKALYKFTNNYGLAILLFTFVIYSLFFPLKWRSSKAMKKAQKMAPRMKELQEKMRSLKPDDPRLRELQMEQLQLMKESNFLGGCLPLLIQTPFFIALYKAITISLDFRQATFLWLPDLSAADPLHLLPVLMAGSILVVQLITPAPSADPLQRRMMAVVVPGVMLYALWSAPAGLLLYWLFGNIITFSQQMLINRSLKSEAQEP